jgi:hypothetical protein
MVVATPQYEADARVRHRRAIPVQLGAVGNESKEIASVRSSEAMLEIGPSSACDAGVISLQLDADCES